MCICLSVPRLSQGIPLLQGRYIRHEGALGVCVATGYAMGILSTSHTPHCANTLSMGVLELDRSHSITYQVPIRSQGRSQHISRESAPNILSELAGKGKPE